MVCGAERTEDVEALAEKVARKQRAEKHRKRAERRDERRRRKRICREVQDLADRHCTQHSDTNHIQIGNKSSERAAALKPLTNGFILKAL